MTSILHPAFISISLWRFGGVLGPREHDAKRVAIHEEGAPANTPPELTLFSFSAAVEKRLKKSPSSTWFSVKEALDWIEKFATFIIKDLEVSLYFEIGQDTFLHFFPRTP